MGRPRYVRQGQSQTPGQQLLRLVSNAVQPYPRQVNEKPQTLHTGDQPTFPPDLRGTCRNPQRRGSGKREVTVGAHGQSHTGTKILNPRVPHGHPCLLQDPQPPPNRPMGLGALVQLEGQLSTAEVLGGPGRPRAVSDGEMR